MRLQSQLYFPHRFGQRVELIKQTPQHGQVPGVGRCGGMFGNDLEPVDTAA